MNRARQKSSPLKSFANFSRTVERNDIKFYTLVTRSVTRKSGKFHYIQNYAAFSHSNLVETLSKIVSTIHVSANTATVNTFWVEENAENVLRYPSRTLVKLFLKLGTALLVRPAENCPICAQVRLLIQKLFCASDEGFKIALYVAPETRCLHGIQIWRVNRLPLFLFQSLSDSSRGGIVQRHVQCAHGGMHLVEYAAPSDNSQLHSSVNFGSRN